MIIKFNLKNSQIKRVAKLLKMYLHSERGSLDLHQYNVPVGSIDLQKKSKTAKEKH